MTELAAALFTQFVLNPRILYPAEILHQWRPGLDVRGTGLYNGLDFWISFGMGKSFSFAFVGIAASIPMLIKFKQARQEQSEVRRSLQPPPGRGDFPLWLMAILWFLGMTTFVYIVHTYMAPNFPLVFLVGFAFLYTPINSYITARTYGILGRDLFEIPYLHETTFILSRYEEIDIWFVPLPDEDYGRGTQSWRVLELTGTTFTSSIAARLLLMPILIVSGIVVWHFVWQVAPIPSAQYPLHRRGGPSMRPMNASGKPRFGMEIVRCCKPFVAIMWRRASPPRWQSMVYSGWRRCRACGSTESLGVSAQIPE